jgi:ACS family hexuronate transporter-like MFS transporter
MSAQTTPSAAEPPSAKPKGNAWKWWLTIVLFMATVLTYLDRQTMSLCGAMICTEFDLSNEQYGELVAAFRWAYAVTHVPAGFMADHLPIRMTYAFAVGLWSAAGAAAALVFRFRPLLMTRAVLGMGEAFNWPCATRIVANMFPPNDRGLASGIFNSGAAVGSLISPLIIMPLAIHFGWRVAFFVIGAVGFFWIALWLLVTRRKSAGYAVVTMGHEYSRTYRIVFALVFLLVGVGAPVVALQYGGWVWVPTQRMLACVADAVPTLATWLYRIPLIILAAVIAWSLAAKGLKSVSFWMLVVVAVTVNPCWYFLNEWIPKYMHDQRNMGYLSAGLVTVPIFLGADLGNLLSGAIIKFLTMRGWSLRTARGTTLAICAAMIGPVALITLVDSAIVVVLLLGLAGLGITSIVANYTACQQDFSFANVGVVAGFLGMSSNVCAAFVNPYIGRYVDYTGNYTLIFALMAVLPAVSVMAIILFDSIVHRQPKAS